MACFRQFSRRIIVEGGELAYSEEESCIENWILYGECHLVEFEIEIEDDSSK